MTTAKWSLTSLPPILGVISCVCNMWVLSRALRMISLLKYQNDALSSQSRNYFVTLIIIALVFTDFVLILDFSLGFMFPGALESSRAFCLTTGVIGQFLGIVHYTLRGLFGGYLLFTLIAIPKKFDYYSRDKASITNNQRFVRILFIVILFSIICTVIPFSNGLHVYTLYYSHGNPVGCWVSLSWTLLMTIVASLTFALDGVAMLVTLFRKYKNQRASSVEHTSTVVYDKINDAYVHLIKQLFAWNVVFAVLVVFVGISLLFDSLLGDSPVWLEATALATFASTGIGNALVWIYNAKLRMDFLAKQEKREKEKLVEVNDAHAPNVNIGMLRAQDSGVEMQTRTENETTTDQYLAESTTNNSNDMSESLLGSHWQT